MELLVVTSSPQSQVHGLYLLLSHSPYLGLGPFFNLSLYLLDGSCRIITYTEAQTSLCLSLVFCHFIPASSYIHSQSQTPSHADHILSLAHIPHPHVKRTHTHPEQIRFPVLVLKRVVLHLGAYRKDRDVLCDTSTMQRCFEHLLHLKASETQSVPSSD